VRGYASLIRSHNIILWKLFDIFGYIWCRADPAAVHQRFWCNLHEAGERNFNRGNYVRGWRRRRRFRWNSWPHRNYWDDFHIQ